MGHDTTTDVEPRGANRHSECLNSRCVLKLLIVIASPLPLSLDCPLLGKKTSRGSYESVSLASNPAYCGDYVFFREICYQRANNGLRIDLAGRPNAEFSWRLCGIKKGLQAGCSKPLFILDGIRSVFCVYLYGNQLPIDLHF